MFYLILTWTRLVLTVLSFTGHIIDKDKAPGARLVDSLCCIAQVFLLAKLIQLL